MRPPTLLLVLAILMTPLAVHAAEVHQKPANIFQPDDRVEPPMVYPYTSVVKVIANWTYDKGAVGSGFLVDAFHVMTAAHVIDDAVLGVAPNIRIVPFMKEGKAPFGFAWSTEVRLSPTWELNRDYRHDMALLTSDRPIGDTTGWMFMGAMQSTNSIYAEELYTAGYPGDLKYGSSIYSCTGQGDGADELMHYHWLDSFPGQSGSPIWYENDSQRYVVSILAYSRGSTQSNLAVRLNTDKADLVSGWLVQDSANKPSSLPDLVDRGIAEYPFSPLYYSAKYGEISSSKVYAGLSYFSIKCEVSNMGTAASDNTEVAFVLTNEEYHTSSPVEIGRVPLDALSVGEHGTATWSGTFPSTIEPGSYTVAWHIDPDDIVSEANESNFVKTPFSIEVQPVGPYTRVFVDGHRANQTWHQGPVSVSFEVTSLYSALNSTQYRINDGNWSEYTHPFNLSISGEHVLQYRSSNVGGMVEPLKTATVRVDSIPPRIQAFSVKNLNGQFFLSWDCHDEHSNIETVTIFMDGHRVHSTDDPSGDVVLHLASPKKVSIQVTDSAGNYATEEITVAHEHNASDGLRVLFFILLFYAFFFAIALLFAFAVTFLVLVFRITVVIIIALTIYLVIRAVNF